MAMMLPPGASGGHRTTTTGTAFRRVGSRLVSGRRRVSYPPEKETEPKSFSSTSLLESPMSNMMVSESEGTGGGPLPGGKRTGGNCKKEPVEEDGADGVEEEEGEEDDDYGEDMVEDSYENVHEPWEASGSYTVGSFALSPNHSINFLGKEIQEAGVAAGSGAGTSFHPSSSSVRRCVAFQFISKGRSSSKSFLSGSCSTTTVTPHASPTGMDAGKHSRFVSLTSSSPGMTNAPSERRSKDLSFLPSSGRDDPLLFLRQNDDHHKHRTTTSATTEEDAAGSGSMCRKGPLPHVGHGEQKKRKEGEETKDSRAKKGGKKGTEQGSSTDMTEVPVSEMSPFPHRPPSPFSIPSPPPSPGNTRTTPLGRLSPTSTTTTTTTTLPRRGNTMSAGLGALHKTFFSDGGAAGMEKGVGSSVPTLPVRELREETKEMDGFFWKREPPGGGGGGGEPHRRLITCTSPGPRAMKGFPFSRTGPTRGGGGEVGKLTTNGFFPFATLIGVGGNGGGKLVHEDVRSPADGVGMKEDVASGFSRHSRGVREKEDPSAPVFYVSYSESYSNSRDKSSSERVRHRRVVQERREREAAVSAELQESCAETGTFLHEHFDGVAEAAAELGLKVVTVPEMAATSLESWNPAHSVEAQSPCLDECSNYHFPLDSNSVSHFSSCVGTPPSLFSPKSGKVSSQRMEWGGRASLSGNLEEGGKKEGKGETEEWKREQKGAPWMTATTAAAAASATSPGKGYQTGNKGKPVGTTTTTMASASPSTPTAQARTQAGETAGRGGGETLGRGGWMEAPLKVAHTGVYKDAFSCCDSDGTLSLLQVSSPGLMSQPSTSTMPMPSTPGNGEEKSNPDGGPIGVFFPVSDITFTPFDGFFPSGGSQQEEQRRRRAKKEDVKSAGAAFVKKMKRTPEEEEDTPVSFSTPYSVPEREKWNYSPIPWGGRPSKEMEDGAGDTMPLVSSSRKSPLPAGSPSVFLSFSTSSSLMPPHYHENTGLLPPSVRHRYGSVVSYGSTAGGGINSPALYKDGDSVSFHSQVKPSVSSPISVVKDVSLPTLSASDAKGRHRRRKRKTSFLKRMKEAKEGTEGDPSEGEDSNRLGHGISSPFSSPLDAGDDENEEYEEEDAAVGMEKKNN